MVPNPDYCGSHDTREEAEACFARYLLDGSREQKYGHWEGCVVCDAPTKKGLATRAPFGEDFALCDEHRTQEQLEALASKSVSRIIASY